MLKKICLGLIALGLTTQTLAAYRMTPTQAFYYHAHKGNLSALQKLKSMGYSVNGSDESGNSALCESIYQQDYSAFAVLRQVGATTSHPCVNKIPSETVQKFNEGYVKWAQAVNSGKITYAGASTQTATTTTSATAATTATTAGTTTATVATTTGLSTAAMVGIGVGAAAVIGGGVALVAGGGGGGGSGGAAVSPAVCSGHGQMVTIGGVCDDEPPYECSGVKHECSCNIGWKGENCENKDPACTGSTSPISNCSSQTTCKYGDQTLYTCTTCEEGWNGTKCDTPNSCSGFQSTCDTVAGYSISGTCLHGDDTWYQCVCNGTEVQGSTFPGGGSSAPFCFTKTCENGGSPISVSKCQCPNSWDGDLCDSCPLSASDTVDSEHCKCKEGYTRSGNTCIDSSIVPACTTNQYWDGNNCQSCPANSTSEGGNATICNCNSGYKKINGVCVWSNCPANQYSSGNACISCPENSTSPAGSTSIDQCVCVRGYTKSAGGQCIGESITDTDIGSEIVKKTISTQETGNNSTIKTVVNSASSVVGLDVKNDAVLNALNGTGSIEISQRGSGNVYGMRDNTNSNYSIYNISLEEESATGTIKITDTSSATGNIYGMYSNAYYDFTEDEENEVVNASVDAKSADTATGIIDILNTSDKNVYGISAITNAMNAQGDIGTANASIIIDNTGSGDIYGIKSSSSLFNAESTKQSTSNAVINIKNAGTGNLYGLFGSKSIFNARAGHVRDFMTSEDYSTSTGFINIENLDSSDVYGIKSESTTDYIYNAQAWDNSTATGKIRINNVLDGNVYGIYGKYIDTAKIQINKTSKAPQATSLINIVNYAKGDAYGLFSDVSENNIKHLSYNGIDSENSFNGLTSTTGNAESTIEMANIADGLAVGIYSKNGNVINSGDIKIHNLNLANTADALAVGIYAEGSTNVDNSGTIIIDNTTYTDNMGTDDTSDDMTYYALPTTDRKNAVGIYVKGSTLTPRTINNSGIITISGMQNAYGIYVEDGTNTTVSNTGTITINDIVNGKNAIKLNGGQLFQNGSMVVSSDEPLNCQNGGTQVNNTCVCLDGWEGELCQNRKQGTLDSLTSTDTGKSVVGVKIIDEDGPYYEINNNENVKVVRESTDSVIGLLAKSEYLRNAYTSEVTQTSAINVEQRGSGDVYGISVSRHDEQEKDADAYYMDVINAKANYNGTATGYVNVVNKGNGNAYGVTITNSANESLDNYIVNADAYTDTNEVTSSIAKSTGIINITNSGNGHVYGISGASANNAYATSYTSGTKIANSEALGIIRIANSGNGNAYGMKATEGGFIENANTEPDSTGVVKATGLINMINFGQGNMYGMYAANANALNKNNENKTSVIELANVSDGLAVGMYGSQWLENSGDIKIHNLGNGTAVGMYADGPSIVHNSGNIIIDRENYTDDMTTESTDDDVTYTANSAKGGMAIGIYGGAGTTITNSGEITINGAENAYGIYSEGSGVVNEGTITIDGESNHSNKIVLNGGKLFQNGTLTVTNTNASPLSVASAISTPKIASIPNVNVAPKASLNLNDFGGIVVASKTSQFVVDGALSGDLEINNDVITDGFKTTYSITDMIQASNTDGLKLKSQSALFDAKLADNGSDVIMQMKGFDTTTQNASLAQFLTTNYALGNNEAFFNKLKSFGNMSALTDSLNKLTGKDMLSRFNFEDMTMMRELNFDMNEKLFHNEERTFALAGSVSPMAFRGDTGSNARYSLYNKRDGKTSIGLGIAFTNLHSDNTHDKDNRRETAYQLILPIGYKTNGFNLMTSPRIGYARGTYDRTGFDNTSYDGTIEKRVFGLMNEARYPITVGKWKFEPSAEFNILGYQQKGSEGNKEFALNIQNQNTYSVEGGIGLYATREEELDKDSTLKLTAGVVAYHEFADPYKLRVGMNGMDGAFTLRDENRSDNRGVIRAGFDYVYRDLSLYGSLISYIDREWRTNAKTGVKWKF